MPNRARAFKGAFPPGRLAADCHPPGVNGKSAHRHAGNDRADADDAAAAGLGIEHLGKPQQARSDSAQEHPDVECPPRPARTPACKGLSTGSGAPCSSVSAPQAEQRCGASAVSGGDGQSLWKALPHVSQTPPCESQNTVRPQRMHCLSMIRVINPLGPRIAIGVRQARRLSPASAWNTIAGRLPAAGDGRYILPCP